MPFYEGIGLIAEKNAVVLDMGLAYTKVGYAGEAAPRAIVPTPVDVRQYLRTKPPSKLRQAFRADKVISVIKPL